MRAARGLLGLDEDDLVACVSCGLCLPHCPTYRVTGLERASPRGRIAAMRAVELGGAPLDASFAGMLEECIQCRGCEAACPSSVPYGRLAAGAVAALHERRRPRWWRRAVERVAFGAVLPHHSVLVAITWLLLVAQRLRLVPRRAGLPRLSARSLARRLDAPRGASPDVWLFTGCVMDAWQRDTHRSSLRLLRAAGVSTVSLPGRGGGCCGALHLHAGRRSEARRLARRVMASMPGDAPIVVGSAGCGAALKEYGELLSTPEAAAFSARVKDLCEFLAGAGAPPLRSTGRTVVVQDPCHLRHVQRVHGAVRQLLGAAYDLLDTDDEGLCCGAGGAYALRERALSGAVRERKVEAIVRAAGRVDPVVASANPGCVFHLRAAGLDVHHPADLLAAALEEGAPVLGAKERV